MKQCSKCKLLKPSSEYFVKDKPTGRLHAQCKDCYKKYRKSYYPIHYRNNKSKYLIRAKEARAKAREEYRRKMIQFLDGKSCVICGEADMRTFEFDHIDPTQKLFGVSQGVRLGYKWEIILAEIQKCRILCANCHKKHTAQQSGWYKLSV